MVQLIKNPEDLADHYCPEMLLLLYCARTDLDDHLITAVKAICSQPIDWNQTLELAEQHGLVPLLYQNLSKICSEFVPAEVLKQLALFCNINALRNQVLTTELLNILTLLKANNIPAIPYKGPVLAVALYGNLALRQFSDLDILVKKQDVLRTREVLCANGYKPYTEMTALEEKKLLKSSYQYKFTHTEGKVNLLEVHWQFARSYPDSMNRFNPFDVDLIPVWNQLDTIALLDQSVPHFALQHLFVLLCIHGAKEKWRSLKSLCDLNELLRSHPDLDLHRALETAKNSEQYKVLCLTLVLLNSLFGTSLPPEILQRIESPTVIRLAAQVQKKILFSAPSRWLHYLIWHLQLIEGFQKQLRYTSWVLTAQFSPNQCDRAFLPLPTQLSLLHHLIRPVRLICVAFGGIAMRHNQR